MPKRCQVWYCYKEPYWCDASYCFNHRCSALGCELRCVNVFFNQFCRQHQYMKERSKRNKQIEKEQKKRMNKCQAPNCKTKSLLKYCDEHKCDKFACDLRRKDDTTRYCSDHQKNSSN